MQRRYKLAALAASIIPWIASAGLAQRAFSGDYFTTVEINRIRDTQEIDRRVEVFVEIAGARLAHLGLVELEDASGPRGNALGRIGGAIIRIINREAGEHIQNEAGRARQDHADQQAAMAEFTRTELLKGYYQALEEAMDNIEDAYERGRGNIRKSIELLRDFTRETIPLLRELEAETPAEETAADDAIEQAEYALERAEYALTVVAKTEQQ